MMISNQSIFLLRERSRRLWMATFLAFGAGLARGATPIPVWYGEPGTYRVGYQFTTGSTSPVPEIIDDPSLAPAATVSLGGFSAGWQDGANTLDLSGVLEDGAWDLGTAGAISVISKHAAAPPDAGSFYRVEFQVFVVAYRGITSLPLFSSPGHTPEDSGFNRFTVAPDPKFPGATWEGLVWTGYFDQVATNELPFVITSPSNNISVVDTFEIFTKVTLVPEPSSAVCFVLAAAVWSIRRRRR